MIEVVVMFTVMTWNLENLERPAADAAGTAQTAYHRKLEQIAALIAHADADLVGVQEILAPPQVLAPAVFDDLQSKLAEVTGVQWSGCLSGSPDSRGIRVAWLSRGQLTQPQDVAAYPAQIPPVTVNDDGTTITAAKRGALAVTYTRADGLTVRAVTAHFKSKLLTFPGPRPAQSRFDTRDEAERARYGLYALAQRAAEAATIRDWATRQLDNHGPDRPLVVCGDLNDTPQAATTQLLLGRSGSQLGTGGYHHADWGDGNRLWNLAPAMPHPNPDIGQQPANWSRINNGIRELIDHILVSHKLVHTLDTTETIPLDGIKSVTADPASLANLEAPSDHRPVIARFNI